MILLRDFRFILQFLQQLLLGGEHEVCAIPQQLFDHLQGAVFLDGDPDGGLPILVFDVEVGHGDQGSDDVQGGVFFDGEVEGGLTHGPVPYVRIHSSVKQVFHGFQRKTFLNTKIRF